MHVDFAAFLLVLVVALGSAVVVVTLFSTGIRLFATPGPAAPATGAARDEEFDDVPRGRRPPLVTAGGVAMFALSGAVAVFGVLLLVVLR